MEKVSSKTVKKAGWTTKDMTYVALFSVLIAVCSWISIPTVVPITLQTLGVFSAVGILGGRRGTYAVLVYMLLGAIGIPVFAGFKGGFGVLLNTTGGYLVGFLIAAALYWGITKVLGERIIVSVAAMVLGLIVCYIFGTAWFMLLYSRANGPVGIMTTLGWCVFPFVIPDLCKIAAATALTKILKPFAR